MKSDVFFRPSESSFHHEVLLLGELFVGGPR